MLGMGETRLESGPTDAEVYHTIRSQIEFEDGLITQRLSWCVAAQSFLFSAYAITLNAPQIPATPTFGHQQLRLHDIIPVVGMGTCLLVYCSVIAGVLAQVRLRRFMAIRVPEARAGVYPPVQGVLETRVLGLCAPFGLPFLFIAVWVYLFIHAVS